VSRAVGALRLRDASRGTLVAGRVTPGLGFWERFRGLMGRAGLGDDEGLYLPVDSIHMLFMRFPIDALFVSAADPAGLRRVVDARQDLRPWRGLVMPVRGAEGVVELPSGTLARTGLQRGDAVVLEPAAAAAGTAAG
jgi:uncharacterized membrane protein (UPF0127 family)